MRLRSVAGALAAAMIVAAGAGVLPSSAPAAQAQGCEPKKPDSPGSAAWEAVDGHVLAAGESVEMDVALALTVRPYPVDAFFVLDASPSMSGVIESLSESIVEAAEQATEELNVDLKAGVAWYGTHGPKTMYVLNRQLSYIDCTFGGSFPPALESGGTEPALFALHEAVVGAGLSDGRYQYPAGRQAQFRRPGLSLVVHATDEKVLEGLRYSPSFDEVAQAYVSRGVHHVGIQGINTSDPEQVTNRPQEVREDLERLSRATKTLAPRPIDCNGDNIDDLPQGEPVVCVYDAGLGSELFDVGDIVVALVDALRPLSTLEIRVQDGAGLIAEGAIVRELHDLAAEPKMLAATAGITCPVDAVGSVHDVVLGGYVDGASVVEPWTITVTCGTPPPGAPPPVAAPPPPVQPAAQPPPPAPQPPPAPLQPTITVAAPNAASATVTSAVPATASQLAPGVMVVPDEAREEQLAYETAGRAPGGDEVLASRRRPAPAPIVTWIAGAMLLTAMTIATQRQRAPQYARARRD